MDVKGMANGKFQMASVNAPCATVDVTIFAICHPPFAIARGPSL
jgi:hypothetical protein